MSSIIEGYNYDIFISYRQKDNRHDGWVTEFVNNLKDELESTFKEEISVYFDNNPHDGLLETHDVDDSLKEKLKCLIFIPIISRTYCDPKSFAWEHEFRAFIEMSSKDKYGLKVKLLSGNVASRILPVRIHDLDLDDIKLCEQVLGSVLRGIEFIYREPGVNRPLKPDDKEEKNLNVSRYNNQINKVANAIRDIIYALKNEGKASSIYNQQGNAERKRLRIKPLFAGISAIMVILIAGLIILPEMRKSPGESGKTIAVMPFRLLSDDPAKQYLADGMMEAITNKISGIRSLRVMPLQSVEQYRGTKKSSHQVGNELDVKYLLYGSYQQNGSSIKLSVNLIDAEQEKQIWNQEYLRNTDQTFNLQNEISESVINEIDALITPEEKKIFEKKPTASNTAWDFYQIGREREKGLDPYLSDSLIILDTERSYRRALANDSTFALAYTGLARIYYYKRYFKDYLTVNYLDSAIVLLDKALSFNPDLDEAYIMKGIVYLSKGRNSAKAKEALQRAIKINPNAWEAYSSLAELYANDDLLEAIKNYNLAAILNHGSQHANLLYNLALQYEVAGFMERADFYNKQLLTLTSDSAVYYRMLGIIQADLENYSDSYELLRKSYSINPEDPSTLFYIFQIAVNAGKIKESLKYAREYLKSSPNQAQVNHRIGYVMLLNNLKDEADTYFDKQFQICMGIINSGRPWAELNYTYYDLAGIMAIRGDKEKAYEYLNIFNKRERMPLWAATLMKNDPLFENMKNEPRFIRIQEDVERKYQAEHERVGNWLKDNNMN